MEGGWAPANRATEGWSQVESADWRGLRAPRRAEGYAARKRQREQPKRGEEQRFPPGTGILAVGLREELRPDHDETAATTRGQACRAVQGSDESGSRDVARSVSQTEPSQV